MSELETLGRIAENIGGEWKDKLLMSNNSNNAYIDAYNDGVKDMAATACRYITAILMGKQNGGDQ